MDKTAFITRKGQFRFKVLSFGLANAPSLFQRTMDLALAGLSWEGCFVYVDDIIVFGRDFAEQLSRLTQVFERLGGAGLKLKPGKCRIFQRRVVFLGHVVSEQGISTDPTKVAALVDWPVPGNVGEARSFMGLASYYRSFVPNFSARAASIFALTKTRVPFVWDACCQEAFDLLKERLTTALVLATPRDGGGFVSDVDACEFGLGCVLQQWQGGLLRVIAYASRTLTDAERVYCTTRKEQLAMIYGLKQFRPYILEYRTVVRSDHAALTFLRRAKEPVGQQARWLYFVEDFDLDLQYRRGTSHANADSLSRRPCEKNGQLCKQCSGRQRETVNANKSGKTDESCYHAGGVTTRAQARCHRPDGVSLSPPGVDDWNPGVQLTAPSIDTSTLVELPPPSEAADTDVDLSGVAVLAPPLDFADDEHLEPEVVVVPPPPKLASDEVKASGGLPDKWTHDWLAEQQTADPDVGIVYRWLVNKVEPTRDVILPYSLEVKNYAAQWASLCLLDGVIYRRFERPNGGTLFHQLIVPRALRPDLLEMVHAGAACHAGVKKTADQLRRRAYWHSWRRDVEIFCRRCAPCSQYVKGRVPRQRLMQDMRVGNPMERLHLDLTGPHPTANGMSYICTAVCGFTKFAVAWPIRDKKAITVAKGLLEKVILPFGACRLLLTDNRREFDNELGHELCRLLGIEKQRTTYYTPQCNAGVERWHSTMHSLLAKTVQAHQRDWPCRLPFVVAAYNGTAHESTKYTPNFLMFGRELPVAVDVILDSPQVAMVSSNDYAEHVARLLADAHEEARQHLRRATERCKRYYDYKSKPTTYQPGDLVWVYSPRRYKGRTPKWQRCYAGPCEIVRRINAVNYAVKRSPRAAPVIVHVDKLKLYTAPGL